MRILDKCVSSTHRTQVTAQSIISYMERYRSGHNGADSKSDGRVIPARGFESHPLRHFFSKSFPVLKVEQSDLRGGAQAGEEAEFVVVADGLAPVGVQPRNHSSASRMVKGVVARRS